MRRIPTEQQWLQNGTVICNATYYHKAWEDNFKVTKMYDGWWEVTAFAGYDGFARYQYDNMEEALAQFNEWCAGAVKFIEEQVELDRL